MSKVYFYIGRFQIPHFGHESVMKHAINEGDKVLILIGSSNTPRSRKNPFSFEERKEMVQNITNKYKGNKKVSILALPDFEKDQDWVDEVKKLVSSISNKDDQVFITGCQKTGDESTFYLKLFPEWKSDFIEEVNFEGIDVISSTKIREMFYGNMDVPDVVSLETKKYLYSFKENNKLLFEELIKN